MTTTCVGAGAEPGVSLLAVAVVLFFACLVAVLVSQRSEFDRTRALDAAELAHARADRDRDRRHAEELQRERARYEARLEAAAHVEAARDAVDRARTHLAETETHRPKRNDRRLASAQFAVCEAERVLGLRRLEAAALDQAVTA